MSPTVRAAAFLFAALLAIPAPFATADATSTSDVVETVADVAARAGLDIELADDAWDSAGRLVVLLDGDAAAGAAGLAPIALAHGGKLARVDTTLGFAVVTLPVEQEAAFTKAAFAVPDVLAIERDVVVRASHLPNDTRYGEQWGPAPIGMPAAWDTTTGTHDVTVAVIDTGIAYDHPDLAANVCVNGPDYVNGDADSYDDMGHGTHVAGTVAAEIDNELGVAGMADACLMALKSLDAWGSGWFADTASAIVWAADNGADIISMSLGGCPGCDPGSPMTEAMQYAAAQGLLIVAAAGNAGCDAVSYPAAYPEAVAVASLDAPGDERSSFSSCGDKVELAAPGRDIVSTSLWSGEALSDPSGYMYLSGTSMATPHVAGVAALVWSHRPTLTADELRCVLAQSATDLSAQNTREETGFGRVDASAALTGECVETLPTAPHLALRAGDAQVELEWTASASWGSNVSAYRVYRGESAETLALLLETTGADRDALDTSVTNGVTYHYAVAAVNDLGEGPLSNVETATPEVPPPFPCIDASDDFGNTCAAIDLAFVDIRETGAPLPGADDQVFAVELPFPVGFYGNAYSMVNVSSNGFLDFFDGATSGCCSGQSIPSAEEPNGIVAALWTDLLPRDAGDITTQSLGEEGSRVFVVQFTEVPFFPGTSDARVTFQFQLHEATGAIEVHYLDADPREERVYSAGIEDCSGTDGIQGAYSDDALVGTAVRYSAGSGTPDGCAMNTAPFVEIQSHDEGDVLEGVVTVSGIAGDHDEGDSVHWVYVSLTGCCGAYATIVGDEWSVELDVAGADPGVQRLEAQTTDGVLWAFDSVRVTVGGEGGPTVTIETPQDGDVVSGSFYVNGTLLDAPDGVMLTVDGGIPEHSTWYGNGTYSSVMATTGFSNGWHTLCVEARGNGSAIACVDVLFESPSGGTSVSIDTPGYGETLSGAFGVEGDYSEADSIVFTIDGTASWSWISYGGGRYHVETSTDGFADGWHALCVDAVNTTSGESARACVDAIFGRSNTPPTSTFGSPMDGWTLSGLVDVYVFPFDADGDETISGVYFAVDGGGWYSLSPGGPSGSWTGAFDTMQVQNGWHTLTSLACDASVCAAGETIGVYVNNSITPTPTPLVAIVTPVDGETVSGNVRIEGTASDGVILVQVRIDGGSWSDAGGATSWVRYWNTTQTWDGHHLIEARAFDGVSWSSTANVTVYVDNPHAPQIVIDGPYHGQSVSGVFAVNGYVWSDRGDATVEVRVDGGEWQRASRWPYGGWWQRYLDGDAIGLGLHDIEARATEDGLASEIVLIQVLVTEESGPAPMVIIDTPEDEDSVRGIVTVSGTATGARPIERVEITTSLGGTTVAHGTDAWSARVDLRDAWGGYVEITARAFDGVQWSYAAYVYVLVDERPDLVLASIEETRGALRTDAGDVPNGLTPREIRVVVRNDGGDLDGDAFVVLRAHTENGGAEICAAYVAAPDDGEETSVTCTWDPAGWVGDVRIEAIVAVDWWTNEVRYDNNGASLQTFVGVGGTGRGVMTPVASSV